MDTTAEQPEVTTTGRVTQDDLATEWLSIDLTHPHPTSARLLLNGELDATTADHLRCTVEDLLHRRAPETLEIDASGLASWTPQGSVATATHHAVRSLGQDSVANTAPALKAHPRLANGLHPNQRPE
ncbi:hypothetical protein ACQP2E_04110 [Actinoplanes sp. CA-015351]|uniref:hypothetical protein n=1 Tax=Actinoplanes sp. CA-015351 TaxID=3239897 RepID=UPI003D98198D